MGWRWMLPLWIGGCTLPVAVDDGAAGESEGSSSSSTTAIGSTSDATTSSSTSSGSLDDDSSTSMSFIALDVATTCASRSGDCDVWAQDCPCDDKCMPWANDGGTFWNATRCSPIPDAPAQSGEPCTIEGGPASGIDDCDGGSMCWGVDAQTGLGTCAAFCTGIPDDPVCEGDAQCFIGYEGAIALCMPSCDPALPMCPLGATCVQGDDDRFSCIPATLVPTSYGDPCNAVQGCGSGLTCVEPSANPSCGEAPCCTALCDLSAPSCPDEGLVCTPYREQLGYCIAQG
ncbi:MAG TPA: hypothetical protein VG755_24205 [Nannocystaceae bacterium]|nr:hypothetical protein [Nannocystaceae bacterium]